MRSLVAIAAALSALPAAAQQLDLPRPSPAAKVSQTVGVTEMSVDYSNPRVKGRKVFGEVVPLEKVWRGGANATTKITFSKDVQIGDARVPAGTYSIFIIPSRDAFTWIVNKDIAAQQDTYKQSNDVARVAARVEQIPARERMTYLFADTTDEATFLTVEWSTSRAKLPIRAFTDEQVKKTIADVEASSWQKHNQVARYLLESKKDPETAMRLVDKSIALQEHWFNLWTKAQLLANAGRYREAHRL